MERALAQAQSSGNSRNQAMEGYLRQAVKEAEDMKVQAQLAKHEMTAEVEAKLVRLAFPGMPPPLSCVDGDGWWR